jgi:hypothetical protein
VKNAYERFGRLLYRRQTEKTATNLRVFLDAFVGEEQGKAHLVSVVGGDVEIGALAAAFTNGDSFTVMDPDESIVSLGEKPMCYRASIMVSGRKRPLRHLVSCSQELADNTSDGKLLLVSDDQLFIWSSLVGHYGLPATPEWGPWMISQLQQGKRIQPLPSIGYTGVAVKAKRKELLALLRRGLVVPKIETGIFQTGGSRPGNSRYSASSVSRVYQTIRNHQNRAIQRAGDSESKTVV